jgi:hypothetical protein
VNELLDLAVNAHGGLDRWNRLTSLAGRFNIGGAIWGFKGVPDVFSDITVALELHTEGITISPVAGPANHSVFRDGRLELRSSSEALLRTVRNPKRAVAGLPGDQPWTALDAAYFASEALWTYLTAPFLFTYPGFETEEVEPLVEYGIGYRTLKVEFPDSVDSHTRAQFFHFDDNGLLYRHTYTVDILGGATGANYPTGYRTIDGIAVPMVRRIYGYDDALRKIGEPVLVTIDISELQFR